MVQIPGMNQNNPPMNKFAAQMIDDPRDYRIGDIPDYMEKIKSIEGDQTLITYNQNKWIKNRRPHSMACTLYQAMTSVTSYWNRRMNDAEIWKMWTYATQRGNPRYYEWQGNYTNNGANTFTKRWGNNMPEKQKMMYFRWGIASDEFVECMKRNLLCGVTYLGNGAYNKDRDNNGVIDRSSFWKATYGHTHAVWWMDNKGYLTMVDNYSNRKTNIYKIKYDNMVNLVKTWVFYPTCYIYLPVNLVTAEQFTEEEMKIMLAMKRSNSYYWNSLEGSQKSINSKKLNKVIDDHQLRLHTTNNEIRDLEREINK